MTSRSTNPWWRVNLGETRTVTHVSIFNLGGDPKFKMSNLIVQVGTGSSSDAICGQRKTIDSNGIVHVHDESFSIDAGGSLRVSCDSRHANAETVRGIEGSDVTITVKGSQKVLHLCEVLFLFRTKFLTDFRYKCLVVRNTCLPCLWDSSCI